MKIRKEVIAFVKYPVIEFKGVLTQDEFTLYSILMDSEKNDWDKYIEDYHYLTTKASSSLLVH